MVWMVLPWWIFDNHTVETGTAESNLPQSAVHTITVIAPTVAVIRGRRAQTRRPERC
jgi:hypothetical protein